jgi:hypothetical protein
VADLPYLVTGTYLVASGEHQSSVVLLALEHVEDLSLGDVEDSPASSLHKIVAMPVPDKLDDAMLPHPCCFASLEAVCPASLSVFPMIGVLLEACSALPAAKIDPA